MGFEVEDIEATVRELRTRGVVFEEYDLPGLETVDGIADIAGNYQQGHRRARSLVPRQRGQHAGDRPGRRQPAARASSPMASVVR